MLARDDEAGEATMNLGELFGAWAPSLGFGGVAGVIVGYTAKKVTKLVAIALGAVFILIQVLAYKRLITVNWEAVQSTAEGVWVDPKGLTLADHAWAILSANLPFGAAFVAGFAIGFKLG
ncbi:MAG: FUN14 domain-containing protein [Deltaproteobacteria bacterium]|nr:FUN14 domain-containing protein [Deltaproteobacteria bacterium]